ncbi:MAG: hypothetical protein ACRC4M_02680 [Mycoplasma sp.]
MNNKYTWSIVIGGLGVLCTLAGIGCAFGSFGPRNEKRNYIENKVSLDFKKEDGSTETINVGVGKDNWLQSYDHKNALPEIHLKELQNKILKNKSLRTKKQLDQINNDVIEIIEYNGNNVEITKENWSLYNTYLVDNLGKWVDKSVIESQLIAAGIVLTVSGIAILISDWYYIEHIAGEED